MTEDMELLHQKIDYLTAQFEAQNKKMQSLEELKDDMLPMMNSLVRLSIEQLSEIGCDVFQIEDLIFLVKRLLRNTQMFIKAMDRLEATMDLIDEVEFLGKQVFDNFTEKLAAMEKAGYFSLAEEGGQVLDRLVHEMSVEDLRMLGGSITPAVKALQEIPEDEDASYFAMLKAFSDPRTRKGMLRLLNVLKTLADQPEIISN